MKSTSYWFVACAVLIAILGTGLAIQTTRHADAVAEIAAKETTRQAEARAYESRIEESARQTALLQSAMDKLIAYRDKRFALALAAFEEASAAGDGKHEGFARAYQIWTNLAEAGDTRANYHMGMMNMFGLGGAEFEQHIGIGNIRLSAKGGYPIAQSFMGFLVEQSDGSLVRTGDELALSWWRKGAEGNHCAGVRRLVKAYQNGELGLDADAAIAAEWQARTETCNKK